jgi:hypothetical protein
MKCSDFIAVITDFDELALSLKFSRSGAGAAQLSTLLLAAGKMTVAGLRKHLETIPLGVAVTGDNFQDLASQFRAVTKFLSAHGKPTVTSDLVEFAKILDHFATSDRSEIIAHAVHSLATKKQSSNTIVRKEIVSSYVRRLEAALGDNDGFGAIFNELSADDALSAAELGEIANIFAFSRVKTKASALKKILGRHQLLMVGRAKLDATGGRVAG